MNERDREFIAAMRAVVAEAGRDFIYTEEHGRTSDGAGRYVFNGEPSCLIGRALARIGVPLEELAKYDRGYDALSVMETLGGFSQKVSLAADYAQSLQDGGATWGVALDKFYEILNESPDRLTDTGAVD